VGRGVLQQRRQSRDCKINSKKGILILGDFKSAETENFCLLDLDISQIACYLGMEKLMQLKEE